MSRFVDRGAVFAGWVGLGMAAVIVLSFELVLPLQSIVFLMAPFAGVLIGYYANTRGGRPVERWGRIVSNAVYAGIVTGASLALLYAAVRFLFFFADTGYRPDAPRAAQTCRTGAECVYERYLADPTYAQLVRDQHITDPDALQAYFLRQQLDGGVALVLLTIGTGVFGGVLYGASRPRDHATGSAGTAPGPNPAA
jgi:hypothetical protein